MFKQRRFGLAATGGTYIECLGGLALLATAPAVSPCRSSSMLPAGVMLCLTTPLTALLGVAGGEG